MNLKANIKKEETIAFTQELVRLNSTSGQEGAVARLIAAKLGSMDFDEIFMDNYGSVIGIRAGLKPGPRVLFDAHMDVVPVNNPESWSCDPFGGDQRDGKIWGRGATDIKGGLAGMVMALGRLPREAFSGALILSATVGEGLIEGAALQKVIERTHPDGVVIIEPSQCRLGTAQKGRTGFWIKVAGRPAHTSHPEEGENAIYRAAEMLQRLRKITLPIDARLGEGVMELIEISSRPFPGECTVPYECLLRFDRRLVNDETLDSVRASIENALAGQDREFTGWQFGFNSSEYTTYTGQIVRRLEFHPGWQMAEDSSWIRKAAQGLEQAGIAPEFFAAPFCTNGSCSAGILKLPTVIFGPSNVSLAHVIDEYISVEELMRGAAGLAGLASRLTG